MHYFWLLTTCHSLSCQDGGSALHWAAHMGRLDVGKVLLEHGANLNAMDNVQLSMNLCMDCR